MRSVRNRAVSWARMRHPLLVAGGLFFAAVLGALPGMPLAEARAQSARPSAPTGESKTITLVADRVEVRGTVLEASGTVDVFHGPVRLRATRIAYDSAAGTLEIEGPLTLSNADGTSVVYADAAALSEDLRAGILTSARVVFEDQLQIAASRIERVEGRYTRLEDTVASACRVCAARPVPLWQIRASQVIQDEVAQQIYFRNARLEVAGLPVFWLPRLRLPDPSLQRATGFLPPEFRSTDALGFGIKIPYFIRLGDHADLTVTPYLSTSETRTLELRYRQAYRTGRIEVNGAITSDDIRPDSLRGYLFAEGSFSLPRGYKLAFDLETVSDDGYLLDYGTSGKDRLDSAIEISRFNRDGFRFAALTVYQTLRDREVNETQPAIIADAAIARRFSPAGLGGIATARLDFHGHLRRSEQPTDGPDADTISDGRDISRLSASLDWRRDWVIGHGMLLGAQTAMAWSHTVVSEDAVYADTTSYLWGAAAVDLRWPLVRPTAGGGRMVLEPVFQLVWADDRTSGLPRDESRLLEFDPGNVLSLNRFPAGDAFEAGQRANIGVKLAYRDGADWGWDMSLARIWRSENLQQFSGSPALDTSRSNWLADARVTLPNRLEISNRALFDDDLRFNQNEVRFAWQSTDIALSGTYLWLKANPEESRLADVSELSLDAEYQINAQWAASLDYRFDFEADRAASARLGLGYKNECLEVDVSLSRRFTSSTSVQPTTDFGLELRLTGFGGTRSNSGLGACNG